MAYKLITEATINIAKLFTSIKVTLAFFEFSTLWISNYDHVENLLKQILGHSGNMDTIELFCLFFLIFFFSLLCFFSPDQRSRLQCKGKFISPYSCVSIYQGPISMYSYILYWPNSFHQTLPTCC